MNDILINVISAVVTTVLLPLITWAGTKLIQYIGTKVKNEKATAFLTTATTIVLNAVRSVFQTYVESLKASGSFNAEAQKTALSKAKDIVVGVLENLSQEIESEKSTSVADSDFNYGLDTALNKIKVLLEDRSRLVETAVSLYEPTVANVCLRLGRSEKVDEEVVSRLLDGLLGFCFDARAVELFKKVCRAALPTNARLVADYIRYYKEEWESKED